MAMKKGTVSVEPGKPLEFTSVEEVADGAQMSGELEAVAAYLKAYRLGARTLLTGSLAGLKDVAPLQLREVCDVFVVRCVDGMLIRYDRSQGDKGVMRLAVSEETVSTVVRRLSDGYVRVVDDPASFVADDSGPTLVLSIGAPTGEVREVSRLYPTIVVRSSFPADFAPPPPPSRPLCLVSVQPIIELEIGGHTAPQSEADTAVGSAPDHFIAHSALRLPVGWEALELYPPQDVAYWDANRAAMCAELDIYAAAAQANLRTIAYQAIDGRGKSRRQYATLLAEFEQLLSGAEEPVHQFLKKHPELLLPTAEKTWSKLAFGDHVSDFVFREATNNYLLVEIEAPIRKLFREDGQQRHELTHAIKQTADWVRYIEDHKPEVEDAMGLAGISTSPRRLVVVGRSNGLSAENRRELVSIQNAQPKLRIITYDEVLASARTNLERILGPLSIIAQNAQLYFYKPNAGPPV
jgi:hypothetical protein